MVYLFYFIHSAGTDKQQLTFRFENLYLTFSTKTNSVHANNLILSTKLKENKRTNWEGVEKMWRWHK